MEDFRQNRMSARQLVLAFHQKAGGDPLDTVDVARTAVLALDVCPFGGECPFTLDEAKEAASLLQPVDE